MHTYTYSFPGLLEFEIKFDSFLCQLDNLFHFSQYFPKILFDHHNNYQYLKFSPENFMFTEGIKKTVRPFYPLCKGRYPGGQKARQGGPKQGIGGELGGGPGLI